MHVAEQDAAGGVGQPAGDRPEPLELLRLPLPLDLALDRAPEQVEHLRDEQHRRDPVLAEAVEDDPRVPAPDVQDVRADVHRVEQAPICSRLCDSGSSDTIRCSIGLMIPWNDSAPASRLSWASITPFGLPVVPDVKTSSNTSTGAGRCHARTCASQSAGRSSPGSSLSDSTVVVGKRSRPDLARVGGVAAGAQEEVLRARRLDDVRDRVGAHPRVERDVDQPRVHRAEVRRRERGRRPRPGQDAVAGLQAEGLEAPRGETGPPLDLAVAPVEGRAVVPAQPQGVLLAVALGG